MPSTFFLYPGTIFVTSEPEIISTILGSCVSVCFFDAALKIGGMNHFMLPLWNGAGLASPKYGNIAIEKLLEKMISFGSKKHNLQAKIFGGSEILSNGNSLFSVGKRNIEVAHQLIEDYGIMVKSSHVGGKTGRKIRFNTATGEVIMSFIQPGNIFQ